MGRVIFKVYDINGNPISGAYITFTAYSTEAVMRIPSNTITNKNVYDAYTDSDGQAQINFADTVLGFNYSYKVSADGYKSATGTGNVGYCYCTFTIPVTLKAVTAPEDGKCPSGYKLENGQCVQESKTEVLGNIAGWFSRHEDAILIVFLVIMVVLIISYFFSD